MGAPASAGTISVYIGDPFTIVLTFQSMNLMNYNHVAQIRKVAGDALVLATFALNKALVGSDTQITLRLPGDSPAGPDSIQRRLGSLAVWDLQQYNPDGSADDTLIVGALSMTADVTR